jgi:tripartite-type tricarboxylate transporter receptor subunit TctC
LFDDGRALAAMLHVLPAQAQKLSNRPVRMIAPAAGGGMDTVTRGLAQKFSETSARISLSIIARREPNRA